MSFTLCIIEHRDCSPSGLRSVLSVNTDSSDHGETFTHNMSFSSSLTLIGQESGGRGSQRAALLEDRVGNSTILCTEVTKLTTALQEYQDLVQVRI